MSGHEFLTMIAMVLTMAFIHRLLIEIIAESKIFHLIFNKVPQLFKRN